MKALTTKQRWTAIVAFAALATVATFTLIGDTFNYYSVCDRCGALRHTKDYNLPLTEFTVFARSVQTETPLSRLLLTNGIVERHSHHWIFGAGGGRGVRCAIGEGRHIRGTVDSEEFSRLVLTLHTHGLTVIRDRVLHGAFDPDTSWVFRGLPSFSPSEQPTTKELLEWYSEQSEYLDELVAASKDR